MTPEELAKKHPKLYHVTESGASQNIQRHGLLSTSRLLDLFEIPYLQRVNIETQRRPVPIVLDHPNHGRVTINDNTPLIETALRRCLDDSLIPSDWLRILNARVFFWASEESLSRLLNARLNRNKVKEVLVVNTLSLARAHAKSIELSAINSGVTFRRAARRGLSTFTPMMKYSYLEWVKLRGGRDKIQEVTVLDGVYDITDHILDVRQIPSFL